MLYIIYEIITLAACISCFIPIFYPVWIPVALVLSITVFTMGGVGTLLGEDMGNSWWLWAFIAMLWGMNLIMMG